MDGRTTPAATATVTLAVTSTPLLLKSTESGPVDTYGVGETIKIKVTASEEVEVIGDPVFRFTIGTGVVRAVYDGAKSTGTELSFTYKVQAGDMDPDGVEIGVGDTTFDLDSNDRIRTAAHKIDVDLSHAAPGTLSSHRVDGSRSADNTAPALATTDGAVVFTDELTLTYNEALDEDSVPAKEQFKVSLDGGTPEAVSAVAVDGFTIADTATRPGR